MIGSSAQGNLAEKVVREGTTRTRERKRGRRRREEQGGCKLNHYDLPCDLPNRPGISRVCIRVCIHGFSRAAA